jgi:hypothetical protein
MARTKKEKKISKEQMGRNRERKVPGPIQGMLVEGKGSVQLTSSLRYLVLLKKCSKYFQFKCELI